MVTGIDRQLPCVGVARPHSFARAATSLARPCSRCWSPGCTARPKPQGLRWVVQIGLSCTHDCNDGQTLDLLLLRVLSPRSRMQVGPHATATPKPSFSYPHPTLTTSLNAGSTS
jgi:hypothetical protein